MNKFITLLLLFTLFTINAQTIKVINGSFEGHAIMGQTERQFDCQGWSSVSRFKGESPPDIHPSGSWQVKLLPSDQNTFLGMVARDNGTYEAIVQELTTPLPKDLWYSFDIDLAVSDKYVSKSRLTYADANYNAPMVLRVYGYDNEGYRELLTMSDPVVNNHWKTNTLFFNAKQMTYFLELEVVYPEEYQKAKNGHILLDNMSDIHFFDSGESLLSLDSLITNNPNVVDQLIAGGYQKKVDLLAENESNITLSHYGNIIKIKDIGDKNLILQHVIIADSEALINDLSILVEDPNILDKLRSSSLKVIKGKTENYVKIDIENGNIIKMSHH